MNLYQSNSWLSIYRFDSIGRFINDSDVRLEFYDSGDIKVSRKIVSTLSNPKISNLFCTVYPHIVLFKIPKNFQNFRGIPWLCCGWHNKGLIPKLITGLFWLRQFSEWRLICYFEIIWYMFKTCYWFLPPPVTRQVQVNRMNKCHWSN